MSMAPNSGSDPPTAQDIQRRENVRFGKGAVEKWEAGGQPAETIGTLRVLYTEDPRYGASFAYDLGRILKSEGRDIQAAEWYWVACHSPRPGGKTRNSLGFRVMTRVVDALEDVGRGQDAAWAIGEAGVKSRRELYLREFQDSAGHPAWRRKWALKLLKDDPKDEAAQKGLVRAERDLEHRKAHPERYRPTRDLPR